MKFLLSVLAAIMVLRVVTATPAEARCWWDGWGWHCAPRYWGYGSYYRPYWGYRRHHYWRYRYW